MGADTTKFFYEPEKKEVGGWVLLLLLVANVCSRLSARPPTPSSHQPRPSPPPSTPPTPPQHTPPHPHTRTQISVVQYFSLAYQINLKAPRLPCVNVSKDSSRMVWLPMEMCR